MSDVPLGGNSLLAQEITIWESVVVKSLQCAVASEVEFEETTEERQDSESDSEAKANSRQDTTKW